MASTKLTEADLAAQMQRVENFCEAQEPVAYLLLLRLEGWVYGLKAGDVEYMSGPVMTIGRSGPL